MLKMTGDEGALLVCVEEHERPCRPPPTPGQVYVDGAMLKMTGDQGVLLVCVCVCVKNRLRPMCVYG